MANTNQLKKIVENEIINTFCVKHKVRRIDISQKELRDIFFDMEPDLVGYHEQSKTLYIGEITTSGYFGANGKDYHVGAVKKIYEAFSRFYLLHDDKEILFSRIKQKGFCMEPNRLKCFFIVPEGSRFINALGYRDRLFKKGYMDLEEIPLLKETYDVMKKVLLDSKNEMLHEK